MRGQMDSPSPMPTASQCSPASSGVEKSVGAAQNDRHAAPAKLVGDVVGAKRIERGRTDGDEVEAFVKRDRVQLFIQKRDLPVRRSQGREIRQGQRHHAPVAGLEHGAVRLGAVVGRLDDEKFVTHARSGDRSCA